MDEQDLRGKMSGEEIMIEVDIGMGQAESILYTTDLSHEYIKINAEYTT